MSLAIFDDLTFIFRWIHYMAGITWIGLLYYFNFVQGSFFTETDANTKKACVQKLVPRALWWFRWAAMFTFLSGLAILLITSHGDMSIFRTSWGVTIMIGALLGTIMFANVWLVIWPNQKIVIAAANGESPKGDPAAAAAKAGLASRTNVLFSIPMLFFMGSARHLPIVVEDTSNTGLFYMLSLGLIGALELNGLIGSMGPLKTIKGVIHCGLALSIVLYGLLEFCL